MMEAELQSDISRFSGAEAKQPACPNHALCGIHVLRQGRSEPYLSPLPALTSSGVHWRGVSMSSYAAPAVCVHRHEHPDHFLHLVLEGVVKYEVSTCGRNLRFVSRPGTICMLPRGTEDEVNWAGATRRIVMAIHPRLLNEALEEAHGKEIELAEHWDLVDRHIFGLVVAMAADLEEGMPAGNIYGESLMNALAVYLLRRHVARALTPSCKGGLPPLRLKRVLDFIAGNLHESISLAQLAAIAGMSTHYFSELFKQSTGQTPHKYVLLQRIERAKERLRDSASSIIDAGLEAGFENPSHFARVFRKAVGVSPSRFRAGL